MAESAETPKSRRRVKNPETFRERAIKASAEDENAVRGHRLRNALLKILRPLVRPFRRVFGAKVFRTAPFRILGKILRFIGRVVWPAYFRNSFRELKLVTWPGWKQSRRLTFAVLAFAVVFGAAIAGLDWGLDKVFKAILLK